MFTPHAGKKLSWSVPMFVGLVIVSLVVGACAPAATPTAEAEPALKLAVLMTGEITDLSWNAQMYSAIMEAKEKLGIEVAYSEQVSPADGERVMREYADEGYNLIIAHSFSYGDAVFRVAQDYPDVNFAWAGGINQTAENVADYDQPFYQASYLVGILAGGVSKGTLNFLGGFDIPVCHSMAESFKLGAQKVNPDAQMLSSYVGDWNDVAKSKEAALAQFDAGGDFGLTCGEAPCLGMIEAAKERGAYAVGYVGDMSELAPDAVITSVVWNLYPLVEVMVKDIQNGAFRPGKFYSLGVAEGSLEVPINPNMKDKIPAETLELMEQVQADITSGSFEVPYIPQ